jgi:hypothetical protein
MSIPKSWLRKSTKMPYKVIVIRKNKNVIRSFKTLEASRKLMDAERKAGRRFGSYIEKQ